MQAISTKRERLLGWIRSGDPNSVPVILGPGFQVAASYLGKDEDSITWAEAAAVADKTGTHNVCCVCSPLPFDSLPFLDDVGLHEGWDRLPDGTPRLTRVIETPDGDMREVREFPRNQGSYHREFFVKGKDDLKAFRHFITKAAREAVKNPAVMQRLDEQIKAKREEVNADFPTSAHVFCPAVELMSSYYMDQETALLTIYDEPDLMEELMEHHWQMTQACLEVIDRNDVDIYSYAINGFEWLSPSLYERYMIPQARRINEFAAAHGKLSWIHTCGKVRRIAEMGAYQQMNVSVVESMSMPPTGDIEDMAETRCSIGPEIATRGGINLELFYGNDRGALLERAAYVLDSTVGHRHMLGDTNPSRPPYCWESIKAVIDLARERGQLFE